MTLFSKHELSSLVYNKLLLVSILFLLVLFSASSIVPIRTINADTANTKKYDIPGKPSDVLDLVVKTKRGEEKLSLPVDGLLFNVIRHYDQNGIFRSLTMKLKPELGQVYQKVGYTSKSEKTVYVYPVFTQAAYGDKGFYDYYDKKCDTACLTVPIPDKIKGSYSSSIMAAFALTLLNYSSINDIDIDKNPDILKKYDKVIVLHNEYVTQREYHAITKHPNVVYLFPNALYAKVNADYKKGTITLVRGHGYPYNSIVNGFRWKNDNSKYEYDFKCDNWQFYHVRNGKMLNCYPNSRVLYDENLLQAIKN
jgi:hypothetical protein